LASYSYNFINANVLSLFCSIENYNVPKEEKKNVRNRLEEQYRLDKERFAASEPAQKHVRTCLIGVK
jgi:hypothetical protein